MKHSIVSLLVLALLVSRSTDAAESLQPNVMFIAVDDLNDWIGCLGGHPQAKAPNFDRLAASGVLFKNAYCAAASCNPSRTAIMSGLAPHRSGLYNNLQKMREVLPQAELMPKYFSRNRYFAHIQEQQQWKQGIQTYLASIHFADAMLGRVLAALENLQQLPLISLFQ